MPPISPNSPPASSPGSSPLNSNNGLTRKSTADRFVDLHKADHDDNDNNTFNKLPLQKRGTSFIDLYNGKKANQQLFLYKCWGTASIDDASFRTHGKPHCAGIESRVQASFAMTSRLVPFLPHDDGTLRSYRKVSHRSLAADCRNEPPLDALDKARMLTPLLGGGGQLPGRSNDHDDDEEEERLGQFDYACYGRTHYAVIESTDDDRDNRNRKSNDRVLIGAPNCSVGVTIKTHDHGGSYLLRLGPLGIDMIDDYGDEEEEQEDHDYDPQRTSDTLGERNRQRYATRLRQREVAQENCEDWQRQQEEKESNNNNNNNEKKDKDDKNSVREMLETLFPGASSPKDTDAMLKKTKELGNKTLENMKTISSAVKENMSDEFPSRVWTSSQRIVGNFGKTTERCRTAAEKLYRFWSDDDDEDDDDF